MTLAVLARQWPREEFGRFTFYLVAFAFFESFVDFGTGAVTLQRGSSDEAAFANALGTARRVRAVTASCVFLLLSAGAFIWEESGAHWIALAALYPLSRILETSSLSFQRRIAHGVPVLVRSVTATGRMLCISGLALGGLRSAPLLLLVHAAWTAAGNVALHLAARKHLPRGTGAEALRHATTFLRAAFPLALASLFQQAYFYVDNLFIRYLLGTEELARYNAAARIFSWLVMVAAYATGAALPWLVRQHEAGQLRAAAFRLSRPLSAVGLLTTALLWPLAEVLVSFVFGNAYGDATPCLRWLLAAALCVFVGSGLLTALIAAGRNWTAAKIAVLALVVNIVGNLWWIPRMGIEGAAAATLASECTVLVASFVMLRKRL